MSVLELLDVPAPLLAYERLELPKAGLVIGGPGSDLVVPLQGQCRISELDGRVVLRASAQATAELGRDGLIDVHFGYVPMSMRVVPAEQPEVGWPDLPACHAAAGSMPGIDAHLVLSDALLELEHPLGLRLRTTARDDDDERKWLAHLAPLRSVGELELHWEGGAVAHAVIRGGVRGMSSFAGHALMHLVRRLEVIAYDPAAVLTTLGGLPWLEELRIHHVEPGQSRSLDKTFREVREKFPRVRAPTYQPRVRMGVEREGRRDELLPDRAIVLEEARNADGVRVSRRFVRWMSAGGWAIPVLGLASGEVVLNGHALERSRGPTWLIPLKGGDVFSIDGVEHRFVVL